MKTCFIYLFLINCLHKVHSVDVQNVSDLNRETIGSLLNDSKAKIKWTPVLNRSILFSSEYQVLEPFVTKRGTGPIHKIDVLDILRQYVSSDRMANTVNIKVIHDLIKHTINCAGLTNASLYIFLILNDVLIFNDTVLKSKLLPESTGAQADLLKAVVEHTVNEVTGHCKHSCDEKEKELKAKRLQKEYYNCNATVYDQFRINMSIDTDKGHVDFWPKTRSKRNKFDLKSIWKNIINEGATLNIKYNIHPTSLKAVFNPDGVVDAMNTDLDEISCVLFSTIKIIDSQLAQKCVDHQGSLVKKYESIKDGLGNKFKSYLNDFDLNDRRSHQPTTWDMFNVLVSDTERMASGTRPLTPEIIRTSPNFQFPTNVKNVEYTDGSSYCFLNKGSTEQDDMSGTRKRKISLNAIYEEDGFKTVKVILT